MLCDKIAGNIKERNTENKQIEYVEIEWHDAFNKIHKKTLADGTEVGIRLDNEILTRGLQPGDILYEDDKKLLVVTIPPCKAIVAKVESHHDHMIAKLCYEIGNRHATLFWGEDEHTFITPYNEPMLVMLQKLHGIQTEVAEVTLDFSRAISSSINAHTH